MWRYFIFEIERKIESVDIRGIFPVDGKRRGKVKEKSHARSIAGVIVFCFPEH